MNKMTNEMQQLLEDACELARGHLGEGRVASYIPELAKTNPANLGVCVMTKEGECFQSGDTEIPFTIQSIGKTFSLILALEDSRRRSQRWAWNPAETALTALSSWR